MAIVVLWAENDHKSRAELLAQTYVAQAINISGGTAPIVIAGLDTLVFWGHGDARHFCGLDEDQFLETVSAWKKKNKNVNTVEMISCNLRHRQGTYTDSYTMKVVAKLKKKHAGIVFKALPVAVSGMGVSCENSILKWQPASQTWAYVGTPGKEDKFMWAMCRKLEEQMPPVGIHNGYVNAHNQLNNTDYLITHKFGVSAGPPPVGAPPKGTVLFENCSRNHMLSVANNSYVRTGSIGALRAALADIK